MLTLDHITTPIIGSTQRPLYANDLISVSRIKKYDQCPHAFELHYIRRLRSSPGVPLIFGNLCHDALEKVYEWIIATQYRGPFPRDRLVDNYQVGFEQSLLSDSQVFEEGRALLADFASRNGIVDHREHIAAERRFEIQVGEWNFLGFIDRIDQPEAGHIVIRDYKTNRLLFSQFDCDKDLQASIYHLAARKMFPEAKKFTFVFDMLRHNVEIETDRDDDQMDAAATYCEGVARKSENNVSYPAKLNTFCAWCDHRHQCSAYSDALAMDPGKALELLSVVTPEGLEAVAEERERVTQLAKLFTQRKQEMEGILKVAISESGPVFAAGMQYKTFRTRGTRKFAGKDDKVVELLVAREFGTEEEVRKSIVGIDTKRLDAFLKRKCKDMKPATAKLLKTEIDSMAKVGYSSRFDARKDKGE